MHPLLLTPGVDGHSAGVGDDHDTNDQVVLLQHGVGDQGYQVQGFVLRAVELGNDHKQVGPRENGAARQTEKNLILKIEYRWILKNGHVQ